MGQRAKPFVITHLDLDRALASCRMTPVEQIVMQYMREHSYGDARRQRLADPLPVRINRKALARATGATRCNIVLAITRLIADRLLIETEGGLLINKRFDEWTGSHTLSCTALAYARSPRGVSTAIHPQCIDRDTPQCIDANTQGVSTAIHPSVSTTIHPDPVPPTPPIEERARQKTEERFKKIPEERSERERACEPDAIDRLASEIVGRIWGLTESDGQPDSMLVYSVASSIRSAGPESSPELARAQAVKAARKSDPASYFFRIARTGGLREDPINLRAGSTPAQSRAADLKAERLASAERLRIKLLAEDEEDQRNGTGR